MKDSVDRARRRLVKAMLALPAAMSAGGAESSQAPLRVAISETLLGDVNLSDARAAMVVWVKRIEQDLKMNLEMDASVFESSDGLEAKLRAGRLDTVAMNILEYRRMREWLDQKEVTIGMHRGKLQYLILVRADSGIEKLSQLKGSRFILMSNPATCIAPGWLTTLIGAADPQGSPGKFFGTLSRESNATRVMLPVFFGKADGCLTTAHSYATMCELNPQVEKRMRRLETSPELVTALYAFRKDWDRELRRQLNQTLVNFQANPSTRQLLAMFQSEGLMVRDPSCLNSALQIIAQAERSGHHLVPPEGLRWR
jgi:ABC-type phosphate/phosphonate transport system substrate-binding protein